MATTAVDQELVDVEHKFWQAMKDKDVDAAVKLTDKSCIIAGAQGVSSINPESQRKMMGGSKWTLVDFELTEMQTMRVTGDIAVVAYKVKEQLTLDGEPLTLEAADTSTWVKRDGQWLCAVHTESVAGDPFGRDRQPAK